MSTALHATETPVRDDTVDDHGHAPILHTSYATERLDPTRLETAHHLPLRSFRLLAPAPRQLLHRSCDDGNQQVHLLKVDAAICLELDLPPGTRYRFWSDRPETLYVDHEPGAVGTVLESTLGGPLRIVSRQPFTFEMVSRRLPQGGGSPAVDTPLDAAAQQSVRELLDIARSLWITPPTAPRRRTSASHVLETVERVLHENPYGTLHPSDFATPAGISVRSLERAMQRAYAMGPKRWITTTRLNTAHRHLRDPGADDRTVAQIARRCGFQHAGRFSQAYRTLFGDYPHDVLAPPVKPRSQAASATTA